MKKMIMAIIVIATAALAGCSENVENSKEIDKAWSDHGFNCYTKVVDIESHKYIIMDGYKCGRIVHAASCWCMKK